MKYLYKLSKIKPKHWVGIKMNTIQAILYCVCVHIYIIYITYIMYILYHVI